MKRLFCLLLVAMLCTPAVCAAPQALWQGGSVGAKAAIVLEAGTGRIAFWQNADERLPMASTTKIMTALITLEQPDLDKPFIVDEKAILVEGSSMGLQKGDTVTLRILAAGMLLASGNDAAGAAAAKIAGSEKAFVALMNQRAQQMGLQNTSFETPSGLDGPNHYSTAYDMAQMARQALANENFAAICGSKTMQLEYGNPPYKRTLSNHNRLLREFPGTIGVKTGFTKKSGRCLVSAAERDGVRLIVVTLSASDDWDIHKYLYNQCFPLFERISPKLPEGYESIAVAGGEVESLALVPTPFEGFTVAKGEGGGVERRVFLPPYLSAPVQAGSVVGRVEYSIAGIVVATQYLAAASDAPARPVVEPPTLWERLRRLLPGSNET